MPNRIYATSSVVEVCHLVAPDLSDQTLCGLSVVPIIIDRPSGTTTLHLTSQPPEQHELCRRCVAIERETITSEI